MRRKFDGTLDGAAFEDDEAGLLSALLGKINPEVLKAARVILDALIESGESLKKKVSKGKPSARARPRHCRSSSILGKRCVVHGGHSGDHRDSGGHIWHQNQRVKKKKAARK